MKLSPTEVNDYLKKHLPYRLNCMRVYDLYLSRRTVKDYVDEEPRFKCYWESEFLEPALEISVVFGRSLLGFLGIKTVEKNTKLNNITVGDEQTDDICIWHVNSGKSAYPISNINSVDQQHLINLIKVAHKSGAHLTSSTTSTNEFGSLESARQIIFRMMLEYVDGLETRALWWKKSP